MGSGFFAENPPSSVKQRERIVPSQRTQARYSIVILINTRSRKTSEMIQPVVGVSLIADPRVLLLLVADRVSRHDVVRWTEELVAHKGKQQAADSHRGAVTRSPSMAKAGDLTPSVHVSVAELSSQRY